MERDPGFGEQTHDKTITGGWSDSGAVVESQCTIRNVGPEFSVELSGSQQFCAERSTSPTAARSVCVFVLSWSPIVYRRSCAAAGLAPNVAGYDYLVISKNESERRCPNSSSFKTVQLDLKLVDRGSRYTNARCRPGVGLEVDQINLPIKASVRSTGPRGTLEITAGLCRSTCLRPGGPRLSRTVHLHLPFPGSLLARLVPGPKWIRITLGEETRRGRDL